MKEEITIGGKVFRYTTFFRSKREANNWVGWKRRQGYLVRIIEGKNKKWEKIYRVYVGSPKK